MSDEFETLSDIAEQCDHHVNSRDRRGGGAKLGHSHQVSKLKRVLQSAGRSHVKKITLAERA